MRNILIITSIYSGNPTGGSDKHTKELVQILQSKFHISILTTTADDYITWRSVFPPGVSEPENYKIIRFMPKKERKPGVFNSYLHRLLKRREISYRDCIEFLDKQGPVVPDLINFVEKNQNNYDFIILVGYLYYPIVYSLSVLKKKAILIPTLHDEQPAYFPIYKKIFTDELIYSFNTPEESSLFEKIYGFSPSRSEVIGITTSISENTPQLTLISRPYALYIGRMDPGKGINSLIEFFSKWSEKSSKKIDLILAGNNPPEMNLPPSIKYAGKISENEKYGLIKGADLVINPSPNESFSILIMEAWSLGIPVLVNKKSEVLQKHCIRSNGGLFFEDFESFSATLDYLLENPIQRTQMGVNGKKYVNMNYSVDVIKEKYLKLFSYLLPLES